MDRISDCGTAQYSIFCSKRGQHATQHFEAKVSFIPKSIRSALDDADFVVQPFDRAERDFVLWLAIGCDSIQMVFDHLSELLIGLQSLPLQTRAPVLKEFARPGLAGVIPQLTEAFLEQVCGVEALVGREQGLQCPFTLQREVGAVGQRVYF